MLHSKKFVKQTRKGAIVKVVREHYLRDDIACGARSCTERACDKSVAKLSDKAPYLLIVDTNVALHQIDFLEHPSVTDVILLSVVLEEVKARDIGVYNRLRAIVSLGGVGGGKGGGGGEMGKESEALGGGKRFYVFSNEHHKDTYIKANPGESPNDRNDRAIRVAAKWYLSHLPALSTNQIVLLTHDAANMKKAKEEGINAMSVRSYVRLVGKTELYDHIASVGGDDEEEGEKGGENGRRRGEKERGEDELSLAQGGRKNDKRKRNYFPEHKPLSEISTGLKSGIFHQGKIRVNRYNCFEAYLSSETLMGRDVLIEGRENVNRAMEGDIVAIELIDERESERVGERVERGNGAREGEGRREGKGKKRDNSRQMILENDAIHEEDEEDEEGEEEGEEGEGDSREKSGRGKGRVGDDQRNEWDEELQVGLSPMTAEDVVPGKSRKGGIGESGRDAEGDVRMGEGGGEEGGGRLLGRVVGIIKRNWKSYCGALQPTKSMPAGTGSLAHALFVANDRRIPKVRIETRQLANLISKRLIVAVDSWERTSLYPSGHYVRSLGEIGDKETENEVLLTENEINTRPFTDAVLSCLPPLPWKLSDNDYLNGRREDLRSLRVFSVDPPGCKDIDDALHCTKMPSGNFNVGVHIADVTHFVHPNTPLDEEASQRGTSVYLVERRIDMLPKPLTEDVCSLRAEVERLAFSVLWEFSPEAEILSTRFTKSVIRSCAALSYVEAQTRMDDLRLHDPVTADLRNLNALAKIMRKRRMDRGALTLASPEVKFEIDTETLNPLDVGMYQIREANMMVEEFMLAANISVSEKILRHFPSCSVLRRHPAPSPSMFDHLLKKTSSLGIEIDVSSSKALAKSLDDAIRPDPFFNKLIRILTTRCMTQALYFPSGELSFPDYYHYGLACPIYTHFTSPIRRYADVLVHRLLSASLDLFPLPPSMKDKASMTALSDNLNFRHRNAQMAGRASVELHTLIFFKNRPTDTEGRVVDVRKNGIIVFVPKYGIEGPVYVSVKPSKASVQKDNKGESGEKAKEEWVLDEEKQKLTSADGRRAFQILDVVNVHIEVVEEQANRSKLSLTLID